MLAGARRRLVGRVRRGTGPPEVAVAVATTSGLAVVDAATGDRMVLAGLLAVGPCLAAVSGRPRIVAATGAYVLVLISLLAWWPNRIWGTQHHLLYLAATTAVTVVSIVVADRVRSLQRAESRAQGHRRAFAAIVEHSEDAIIAVDLDGTITGWNSGAEQIYGYSAAEMIGASSQAFQSRVRPEGVDASDARDIWARILAGERHIRYDTRRRHRDGRVMDVSMTVSPILDDDAAVVGISSICRDISATKQAEQAQRAAEERSQQAQRMASLGQLAAGVAHDFNNLLGIILNYTAFAADRADDIADDAIGSDLGRVRVAAERAVGLTRQLLTFTREDTVRPEVLDVNAAITEARDLLARTIGAHIELIAVPSPVPLMIYADAGRVQQILVNLAVNARDAMPEGGTLVIEAAAADPGERQPPLRPAPTGGRHVRLLVSDTGTGMSTEVADRIFEPFYTTKPRGQGTGLGLATVYGIVTEAGGSIQVSSEPGVGTTFVVYVPLVDAPEPLTPGVPPGPARVPPGRGQTILVVEDEPVLGYGVARMLEGNGYRVLSADGAAVALDLHAEHGCDLLLTDIVMPDTSGRRLADLLHQREPDLPVLFMSGYPDGQLGTAHPGGEEVTFIEKPFTADRLLTEVHRALAPAVDGADPLAAGPERRNVAG
ncbi:hybrid sensor histidine kinase/response regulator [Actinoplanes sp. ATCC 53533]|nr:hybrid sensor histidine kinase/response regulator [Actinoplanes sp. ATCC 53533]